MGTILDLTSGAHAPRKPSASQAPAEAKAPDAQQKSVDRARLVDELRALRQREQLVMQTLAVVDHPELRNPIRELKVLLEASFHARAQLTALPSEEERSELASLSHQLDALHEQRIALDSQIEKLELARDEARERRLCERKAEHARTVEQLLLAMSSHEPTFADAGISVHVLFPELQALHDEQPTEDALGLLTADVHDDDVLDALAPPSSTRSTMPPPLRV